MNSRLACLGLLVCLSGCASTKLPPSATAEQVDRLSHQVGVLEQNTHIVLENQKVLYNSAPMVCTGSSMTVKVGKLDIDVPKSTKLDVPAVKGLFPGAKLDFPPHHILLEGVEFITTEPCPQGQSFPIR